MEKDWTDLGAIFPWADRFLEWDGLTELTRWFRRHSRGDCEWHGTTARSGEQADKSKGKGRGLRALDQSTD